MAKKFGALLAACCLTLCVGSTAFAAESGYDLPEEEIPQEVLEVAQDGVGWVGGKVLSDPEKWEMPDNIAAEDLSLGQGFKIHYITNTTVEQASGNSLLKLVDTSLVDEWEFTIDANGTSTLFLTVGYEDGDCIVTGWGGDARSYGEVRDRLLADQEVEHMALIGYGQCYYFAVEKKENTEIIAVDDEEMQDLSAYSQDSAVSIEDFAAAIAATEKWGQEQSAVAGGEIIYGVMGVVSPDMIAGKQETPISAVSLLGGLIIVSCVCWYLYRKHKNQGGKGTIGDQ